MEGKFEGSGLDLLFEIDYHHGVLVVVIFFEVWHAEDPFAMPNFIKKCRVFGVFLQPQRLVKGRALARPSERSERFEPFVRGINALAKMITPYRHRPWQVLHSVVVRLASYLLCRSR